MGRVLVVEDDDTLRVVVRRYLEDASHAVAEAASGQEALKRLDAERFDAVVLDITLGDMEGMAVLRRVRARRGDRHLPIVMLSGHSSKETIEEARQLGASAYLTKPVVRDDLVRAIERLVPEGDPS